MVKTFAERIFVFAENSTDIIGDPLEGTSVWYWNNTDLVSFPVFIAVCGGKNRLAIL